MNTGAAFVANRQTAEAMEPGQGTFNDPARAAEPAPIGGAALRQQGGDAPSRQFIAMRLRIIAAVPLNQSRFPYGRPTRPRTGGIASTRGSSSVMSFRLAAVSVATSGIPCASVRT